MSQLKTRLDKLSRTLGIGGAGYSWPETVDVRGLSPAQRAAAIAGAEARAQGKEFKGVAIVVIDEHRAKSPYDKARYLTQ